MQQFKRRQAFVVTYCELGGAEKQIWRMEPIKTREVKGTIALDAKILPTMHQNEVIHACPIETKKEI